MTKARTIQIVGKLRYPDKNRFIYLVKLIEKQPQRVAFLKCCLIVIQSLRSSRFSPSYLKWKYFIEQKNKCKKGASLSEMLAYVDEFGNLTSVPLDYKYKKEASLDDIKISVPTQ